VDWLLIRSTTIRHPARLDTKAKGASACLPPAVVTGAEACLGQTVHRLAEERVGGLAEIAGQFGRRVDVHDPPLDLVERQAKQIGDVALPRILFRNVGVNDKGLA
jgi:hypothetical protein